MKELLLGMVIISALSLGGCGISDEEQEMIDLYPDLIQENKALRNENEEIKSKNEELQARIKEAEPFFNLQETEKEAMKLESEKKEEELKQQKAQENSKTFSTGYYIVGEDIEAGRYDLVHVKGIYGFVKFGNNSYAIGTHRSYATEVKNVKLVQGDEIEVDGTLTVSFIPKE